MNITIAELEHRLVQLKNEYLYLEEQFNDLDQPDSAIFEKLVELAHTIELLENEIDRRNGL